MPTIRGLLSLACLSLLTVPVTAAPPPERDLWYTYVDEELRYGSRHVVVTELPDGRFRYVIDTRMLVDLFGAQRQETTTHAECLVAADLTPVSLRATTTQMSGVTEVTGTMAGRTWTVEVDRGGTVGKSTYALGPDDTIVLEACLDDWLAGVPEETTTARTRVVATGTGQVGKATADRILDAVNHAWKVTWSDRFGATAIELDTRGIEREQWHRTPKLHRRRCSADEAASLAYRVWDGRELLTFPLDRETGPVAKLERLAVRLTWNDVPFDDLDLEDIRQRVRSRSEEHGEYEAVVELSRRALPTSSPSIPIGDTRYSRYLADTEFIKPSDTDIARTAAAVIGDEATALDAVRSLTSFVHGHIEGTLIAETLSGPEVLRQKTGKCSEYTTLFASLSRAAGIPTRVALGERLVTGRWMGHMWAEAYVGDWVPVDASANEVGDTCVLLKLVHSATVLGTQPVRWRLTESLDISVVEVEQRKDALADLYRTGIDGHVYTNVEYGFRITAPVDAWTLEDISKPGAVTVRFRVPELDDVLIHLVVFDLPRGTRPETITMARMGLFGSRAASFEKQLDEPRTIAGSTGHMTRFLTTQRETGDRYLTTEVVWTSGATGFLVNLIATETAHETHWPDVDLMLNGFEHLEPAPE